MTEKEYKILCKLIDLRTTIKEHDSGYYGSYNETLITKDNIKGLKADIKETLVESEDEQ